MAPWRSGYAAVCLPAGDPPKGDKTYMSYFVYVLKSQKNGDLYVGSTANIENRLRLHNSGRVKSTKGYKPWSLLEFRECESRADAVTLERHLKTGQQKELLRKKYSDGALAE